jgi:hypothetical protein
LGTMCKPSSQERGKPTVFNFGTHLTFRVQWTLRTRLMGGGLFFEGGGGRG